MENLKSERSPFLYNAWYCAGWAKELGSEMIARTLLEIPVLLYRDNEGTAVAVKDECPHRFVPLSMGHIDGDHVVCPYHGLRFAPDGSCDDKRVSQKGRQGPCLRTFPLVEQNNVLWIWMGDAALADPADIPDYGFLADEARPKFFDYTHVSANYELEIDNLLDLSHLDYVHKATIAQDISHVGKFEVQQEGNRVGSIWRADSVPRPKLWEPFFPGDDVRLDMWMDMYWQPGAAMMLDTGTKAAGAPNEGAHGTLQAHFPTPETRNTTHYFWAVTKNADHGVPIDLLHDGTRQAFEGEDQPIIEAVQQRMGSDDFWKKQPIILEEDGAAIRARRVLDQLIKREAGGAQATLEAAE